MCTAHVNGNEKKPKVVLCIQIGEKKPNPTAKQTKAKKKKTTTRTQHKYGIIIISSTDYD